MSLILSIDIGTTKIAALALDSESHKPIAIRAQANASDLSGLPPERHEQDPLEIKRQAFALVSGLLKDEAVRARPISAIGITGQMHGVLLVDAQLEPLTPLITWRDGRTTAQISAWQEALGAEAPARLGCRLAAGYGGPTLAWLHQAGRWPAGARAVSIAGFLAAALSGETASDPTHAASWGIYNLYTGSWDPATLDVLGIPAEVLPGIQPCAQPIGGLNQKSCAELGLAKHVRVCSPLGDNQAGVYALSEGRSDTLVFNLGTGGQVSRPQTGFSYSAGLETRPMPFGGSIQVGSSLCGGWSYAYLRQFYQAVLREIGGVELDDGAVYAHMNHWIERGDVSGLSVDTRFSGSRLEPVQRGMLTGIDTQNFSPAGLTRAWAVGMVEELYTLARVIGLDGIRAVVAAGNAVRKNPALTGIITQRFGLPCTVSDELEEAALGAARAAGALGNASRR